MYVSPAFKTAFNLQSCWEARSLVCIWSRISDLFYSSPAPCRLFLHTSHRCAQPCHLAWYSPQCVGVCNLLSFEKSSSFPFILRDAQKTVELIRWWHATVGQPVLWMPLLKSALIVEEGIQGDFLICGGLCSKSLYVLMAVALFISSQIAQFPCSCHSKYTASASVVLWWSFPGGGLTHPC